MTNQYKKLAQTIIIQAAKDAKRGDEKAYWFLSTYNPLLEHWCLVAEVNIHVVMNKFK